MLSHINYKNCDLLFQHQKTLLKNDKKDKTENQCS